MGSDALVQAKCKNETVKSVFLKIVDEIELDGILDHEVRAAESIMSQNLPTNVRNRYKIHKHADPSDTLKPFSGRVYVYLYGASIWFPPEPKANRLHQMVIIAHELGHLCLGHVAAAIQGKPLDSVLIKDPAIEKEAFDFARMIVERRSNQYKDEKFLNSRRFSKSQIDNAIESITTQRLKR